ncbi:MAG TPA: DUF1844 domain-containing protein [Pyrinomonadaceae bacterium]|jgi:hypothetical protein
MSEEKPTFKVTDRRLFNADGTPREIEREEEAPAAPPPAAQQQTAAAGATTDGSASGPHETARAASDDATAGLNPPPAPAQEPETGAGSDPTPFANLVMFIASPAAAALGMTEHPGFPAGEVDLPLAKHCIDLLVTIQQKTRGNLSAQEQQILESLRAELQMQYVSLANTRPPARPRGFSGSDITGGR